MAITKTEITLIRASFDQIRARFDVHSTYFYDALFRHAPELRAMFRDDLSGQGMKFMTTLGVILEKLEDEDQIAEQYTSLGKSHAALGVKAGHFEPMEEALIDTMRNALGSKFTPELERAWRSAYSEVSANMIKRGHIPS